VRVELTALVAGEDVQLREVTVAHDLHVEGRLEERDARDGAVGDEARVVARLCAPCDLDGLYRRC
jgi:hypothetical protein